MAISYKRLLIKLVEKDKQLQDLYGIVSTATVAKIKKSEYINLQTLEKIAEFLECDIGDLVSIKDSTK